MLPSGCDGVGSRKTFDVYRRRGDQKIKDTDRASMILLIKTWNMAIVTAFI
jgi:hypothetical protein